jgi:hypothetical protein
MFRSTAGTGKKILFVITSFLIVLMIAAKPSGSMRGIMPKSSGADLHQEDLSTPIKVSLQIDPIPLIGESATLTCNVTSSLDAPGTHVQIELPPDATLLVGSLEWNGDLAANVPLSLPVEVAFNAGGKEAISCRALRYVNEDETWGDGAVLYMTAGVETSFLGYPPETPEEGALMAQMDVPGEGDVLEGIPLVFPEVQSMVDVPSFDNIPLDQAPVSPEAVDSLTHPLTITGRFYYFNRDNVQTGIWGMLVKIANGSTGAVLAYCYPFNTSGDYSCGPFENPGSVGVRATAMTWVSYSPNSDVVAVVNPAWGTTSDMANTYTMNTSVQVFGDGTRSIGTWYVGAGVVKERAFWMHRDLGDAFRFVYNNGSQYQSTPITTGPTTLEWQDGLAPPAGNGEAYYTTHGNIHIFNDQPLSVSVVHHEYGHNIMHNVYGVDYDSLREACDPNLPHTYQALGNDGCAWNEGWATFIDLATRNDSTYRWSNGGTLDLEPPTYGTTGWENGDTVIGRVTGGLWDMYDSAKDGSDENSQAFSSMWDTYTGPPHAHNLSNYHANFVTFTDPTMSPVMAIYQNTIDYRSSPAGAFNKSSPADGAGSQPATVNLTWGTSSGASGYAYCFDTINNDTCDASWISVGTSLSSNITLPTASTTYYWEVRSRTSSSYTYAGGNPTSWRSFTTVAMPGAFDKVSPANAATNQPFSVILDWGTSSGADRYEYCYATSTTACTSWISTGTTSQATISSLTPGTTYYWQVRAVNTFNTRTANGTHWSFTVIPCYTLTTSANPSGSGSTGASPASNCSGGKYTSGTVVALTATANSGYAFSSWGGGATGTTNPVNVTMSGNKSVIAYFTPCYTVSTTVTGSGSVGVSPASNCAGGLYKGGTILTMTANPGANNVFLNWSGSLTGSTNPDTLTLMSNATVTANFKGCYALTTAVSGSGTVSVNPASNCTYGYLSGTSVTFTAMPNTGNSFANWSGAFSGSLNPKVYSITTATSVTANFLPCYSLTTSVSPLASGTVTPSPLPNCAGKYVSGTNVNLTAVPGTGRTFFNWSGSISSSSNPVALVMNANKDITANIIIVPSIPSLLAPAANALVTTYTPSLDWSDSTPNLDHYQLQVANDAAFTTLIDDQPALGASTYTPGVSLPSNSMLTWRVRAFDINGLSRGWSAVRTFRTALLAPELSTPLDAENLLNNRPTFDWDDIPGASGYTIKVSKNDLFTQLVGTYPVTASAYTPTTALPANVTLYWRVQSLGANGPSAWSATRSIVTANPPGVPALVLPASKALTTDYTPRLDWGLVTLPVGVSFGNYQVQVADNAAFTAPAVDESGLNDRLVHEYTPPADLNPNTTYYWRARSYNADGEYSAWSLVRTFRTALLPPLQSAPLDAEDLLNNRPTFDWDDVPGATGYSIQISKNSGFTLMVGTYPATLSTYTPTVNLPANKTLYWRVQTRGTNGPSVWSSARSFNTANPPGVPVLLLPANNALTTDYTPRLDWGVVTLPVGTTFDHYQVQVADNAAFDLLAVDESGLTDRLVHEYTPGTDLNANTKYYWRVRSYNADDEYSAWSLVRYFRTAVLPPVLYDPSLSGTVSQLRPAFDWGDVTGAINYTIQVSKNSTFTLMVVNATTTTVGIPSIYTPLVNLPTNITLFWRVRANGPNGPSGWSPVWDFTIMP